MNSVEQALNTPASDPISAESSPATTMPRTPAAAGTAPSSGTRLATRPGSRCPSGPIIGASSGTLPLFASAKQIRPGMMNRYTGNSFRNAAKMLPRRAIGLVRRAQRALHDVLVRAPVPQADDRRAEQPSRATGSCR